MNRRSQLIAPAKRSLTTILSTVAILFAVALSLYLAPAQSAGARSSTPVVDASTVPQHVPQGCCGGSVGDDKPHLLAASYYTVNNGLSAKLLLNNKGPRPIEVKPMLFSMGGEKYEVASVIVEGNSFQILDISGWIGAVGPQFQEGSIQVFHLGRDLVIGAQIYLEDDAHSLAFEEKFSEPATFHSSQLRGVWWLPSQKGKVFLALSNTSDSAVTATARADGQRPRRGGSIRVGLAPHETRLLNVQEDLFGNGSGAMSRLGGISVEHNGPAGAVLARSFAQESDSGYSLAVQFTDPQGAKSSAYQGAGLRLGAAGGETLMPVVVAYNAGAEETIVTGRMPYATSDGNTAEVPLPEVRLSPGESREVDVASTARAAGVPMDVSAAGLEFEYSTGPGSVQMTALSVGVSGNQVFRVPMWDVPAQRSGTGGYPWRIEGNSSTIVYLKNTTDRPQDYTFQISYEGGVYVLGMRTIGPRQTVSVDVRALRDQQAPDINGATIPLTAERGQIVWSVRGPDLLAMLGRSEQVDVVKGVSSNYACMYCCGNSFYAASISPTSPAATGVGATVQFTAYETDTNCYGGQLAPYQYSGPITWNSHDTTAATINPSGLATGVAAGSTGIDATWTAHACSGFVNNSFTVHTPTTTLYTVTVVFKKADNSTLPSPMRIGINSLTLAGSLQDRTQHLKAVVTPAAQASNITLTPDKIQISNQSADSTTGVVTFDAVGITPSDQQGDGSIKAKIGSVVVGTQTLTVVVPAKLVHSSNTGSGIVIQNIAMNPTTTPPSYRVSRSQYELNTNYYRNLTITVTDKWDIPVGDVYVGAEITEVLGTFEGSINYPLTASGTYVDPVGLFMEGDVVSVGDSRIAAWPSQPRLEALAPGTNHPSTQNITVKVAGFQLDPAIARSVTLIRDMAGAYSLDIIWP